MSFKCVADPVGEVISPFTGEVVELNKYRVKHIEPKVHKKPVRAIFKKAIVSGDVIEFIEYEKPVFEGYDGVTGGKKVNSKGVKRKDKINGAKMNLRRLINANSTAGMKFITLTYRENMSDIKQGKADFKNFIKRWNYRRKKEGIEALKYVYVVEFQKRGAVHFHCIFFNVKYIDARQLESLWSNGFVKVNNINGVDNIGAYVVKYMDKAVSDERLSNCDLYGRSRGNLKEPEEIKNPQELALLESVYIDKLVYEKTYQTDYHGNVIYKQYNLLRNNRQVSQRGKADAL